jgi:hypothetical protein
MADEGVAMGVPIKDLVATGSCAGMVMEGFTGPATTDLDEDATLSAALDFREPAEDLGRGLDPRLDEPEVDFAIRGALPAKEQRLRRLTQLAQRPPVERTKHS